MANDVLKMKLVNQLAKWKLNHGRDISMRELVALGFAETQIDAWVREGILYKYQSVAKGGRSENRYRLHLDWRSLRV